VRISLLFKGTPRAVPDTRSTSLDNKRLAFALLKLITQIKGITS
jgi:hypothetical protein